MAIDYTIPILSIVGGAFVSFAILFAGRFFNRYDRTADSATATTINLTNVASDVEETRKQTAETRKHLDEKFDELKEKIDCIEKERRKETREMWEKMSDISGDMKVIKNRLDRLERNGGTQR